MIMASQVPRLYHLTSESVLAYPYLTETETFKGKDTGNYSVTLIIQDQDDYEELNAKILEVGQAIHGKNPFNNPLKATDDDRGGNSTPLIERGAPEGWSIKATSKFRIDLVDRDPKKPLQAVQFYPGLIVRAHLCLVPYEGMGRGVKPYLEGLQRVKDAPRLNLGGSGTPFQNLDDPREDRMVPATEEMEL
jgi:hypothetical protein